MATPDDYNGDTDLTQIEPSALSNDWDHRRCIHRRVINSGKVEFKHGRMPWWMNCDCRCSQEALRRALTIDVTKNGKFQLGDSEDAWVDITNRHQRSKSKHLLIRHQGRYYKSFTLKVRHGELFISNCGMNNITFRPSSADRVRKKTNLAKMFVLNNRAALRGRVFRIRRNNGQYSTRVKVGGVYSNGRMETHAIFNKPIWTNPMSFSSRVDLYADINGAPALCFSDAIGVKKDQDVVMDPFQQREIARNWQANVAIKPLTNYNAVVVMLRKVGLPVEIIEIICNFIK
jgi:hypothetical protein